MTCATLRTGMNKSVQRWAFDLLQKQWRDSKVLQLVVPFRGLVASTRGSVLGLPLASFPSHPDDPTPLD